MFAHFSVESGNERKVLLLIANWLSSSLFCFCGLPSFQGGYQLLLFVPVQIEFENFLRFKMSDSWRLIRMGYTRTHPDAA